MWKLANDDIFFIVNFFQQHKKCTDFLHHSQLAIIPVSKSQRTGKYLLCNSWQKFGLATVMYCIGHDYISFLDFLPIVQEAETWMGR